MPLLAIGGLLAAATVGLTARCDVGQKGIQASISDAGAPAAALPAGGAVEIPLASRVREHAGHVSALLGLTTSEREALESILLHEADRLDAAAEQVGDPLMEEALADHRRAVAEWKAREMGRVFGEDLAARIVVAESTSGDD